MVMVVRSNAFAWLFAVAAMVLALMQAVPARAQSAAPAASSDTPSASSSGPLPASPPDTAAKKQAEERFVRGLQIARTQAWDAALAEFLASRELFPTRVALKNAAMCLEQLHRYAEGAEMLDELFERFGAGLPSEERMTLMDMNERLRRNTASLSVDANQPGASVVVDNRERGTTPLPKPLLVDAGTHHIRIFKEGFSPFETQIVVAGQQQKAVRAELKALEQAGKLVVQEASGQPLEVVIDGAVVGKTPWTGALSVGVHTVWLRGDGELGTPPSSATVFANQVSTLTLGATKLDAQLRVEPTPSNARVDIDGVPVGNGVWEGRLKSGRHRIEVAAPGFIAFREDKSVASGQREIARVTLERDSSDPIWRAKVFRPHLYVELFGGPAWSPSFKGSADAACAAGECSDRSRPMGFLGGARGGYQLTSGLGLELFLGYVRMSESMTRKQTATVEGQSLRSEDYRDETRFDGPAFGASASYQFLDKTPLLFRLWAGVVRAKAQFENGGTFAGTMPIGTPPQPGAVNVGLSVPETSRQLWMPIVGPEARIGYRFSPRFTMDFGVAFLFAFPQSQDRIGTTALSRDNRRVTVDLPGGKGVGELPKESAFGTYFIVLPTIGGRFDF